MSEDLREVMRQWTTGVAIICSNYLNQMHGMTVNSFTSVSLSPPLITITMANNTRTCQMVLKSGVFTVSILKDTQTIQADKFSGKSQEAVSRFSGVETIELPSGTIAIQGSLAVLDCKVREMIPFENSTLFLAEVMYARVINQGNPLVYHNREYHIL